MALKIHTHTGGPVATNGYLIVDTARKQAALIDAPRDVVAPLLNVAKHEGYDVRYLLLTHGHWDHTADHAVLTAAFPEAPVWIHPLDGPKLEKPGSKLMQLPFVIPGRKADGHIADNQMIEIGDTRWQALHTPGHAPGHVALYNAADKVLLAGDLLFAGSIGRTDLPDSDPAAMRVSLARVMELPDDVRVLSGHGPATTIGRERATNPWLIAR